MQDRGRQFHTDGSPVVRPIISGRGADFFCPIAPQWWLVKSFHPYAPFPGNALEWDSNVYDDGTTYEGLMMLDVPHNKGVLRFGNIGGGGIKSFVPGDVYEGEFDAGFAHGLGRKTSPRMHTIFLGEFWSGQRKGCGLELDTSAYDALVARGVAASEAWARTREHMVATAETGTWARDVLVHRGPDDENEVHCTRSEIAGVAQEAAELAARAAMFAHKPDGDVGMRLRLDAKGDPLWTLQDALAYPYQTQFLAPGPLGDAHAVPQHPGLHARMRAAWKNHQRAWDKHNLHPEAAEGSDLDFGAEAFALRLAATHALKDFLYARANRGKRRPRGTLRPWRQQTPEEAAEDRQAGGRGLWSFWRSFSGSQASAQGGGRRRRWRRRGGEEEEEEEEGRGADGGARATSRDETRAARPADDLLVAGEEEEEGAPLAHVGPGLARALGAAVRWKERAMERGRQRWGGWRQG